MCCGEDRYLRSMHGSGNRERPADSRDAQVIPRARATVPSACAMIIGSPVPYASEMSSACASGDLRCSAGSNFQVFITVHRFRFLQGKQSGCAGSNRNTGPSRCLP